MISDSGGGWRLANWVRDNASKLGVSEVIYSQKIWTVQRSGEGWRGMSDRGSSTANHYDHVHVSVYWNRPPERRFSSSSPTAAAVALLEACDAAPSVLP